MTVSEIATDTHSHWHPELRERWAGERLYFWRLTFPTYDKAAVVENLEEVMGRVGVKAYAIYELYGGYDILLRVWLPTTQKVFESAFHAVFQSNEIVIDEFSVNEIVTHWPWATEDGSMRRLPDDVVADRLPNSEIELINAGPDLAEMAEYHERGIIAPSWPSQGVKFIVLVGRPKQPLSNAATNHMRDTLLQIVLDADDDAFTEKSIYKGLGFCTYLILGRVRKDKFHLIESEIVHPINQFVGPKQFGSRTTTFPMSTEDFLAFSEKMSLEDETPNQRSAAEWLEEEEGQHLEVKGSAFADLKPWLYADDPEATPEMNDVAVDILLKAITGLLNAEGGSIVVGALEADRYADLARLADLPRVGSYVVLGLNAELGERNWNWDKWGLTLRQLLGTRIDGNTHPYVSFHYDGVESRPVCVISIKEPPRSPTSGTWYWHRAADGTHPQFWVREGNRTVEKEGGDVTEYQREKTRRATDPT